MNFLQPLFLYALPLLSIPILIHFFTRRKRRIIPFSSIRFLKLLENRRMRSLRIQQWILLLLRTAAIGMLILAFSRPVLRGSFSFGQGGAKTAAVLIIDNSLSMGATVGNRRFFDNAQESAGKILSVFQPGDELSIWYPAEMNLSEVKSAVGEKDAALRAIAQGFLSFERGKLTEALVAAHKLLKQSAAANKEIYLFSDLQNSEFEIESLENDSLSRYQVSNFFVNQASINPDNFGLSGIEFLTQIMEHNKNIDIASEISATGSTVPKERLLSIYLEGKRLSQKTIDVNGQSARPFSFTFLPDTPGLRQGYIEIEPDLLDEDNRVYFTFHVPERIDILLVGQENRAQNFFRMALEPREKEELGTLKVTSVSHPLKGGNFSNHDVLIYYDVSQFSSSDLSLIQDYLGKSKGVLIALTESTDISSYNSQIAGPLGLSKCKGQIGNPESRDEYFTIDNLDLSHPIFQGMFETSPEKLGPAHLYAVAAFPNDSLGKDVILLQNQIPLLIEYERQSGHILLFTGGMLLSSSDFPLKGLYSPLINRSVRYLALNRQAAGGLQYIGEPLRFNYGQRARQFEIVRPDGEIIRPSVEMKGNGYVITYTGTNVPGIYALKVDDRVRDKIAVNINPKESDLRPVETYKLLGVLPRLHVLPDREEEVLTVIKESRYGSELAMYFILAALFFLAAEMWIARYRKDEAPFETIEKAAVSHGA